YDYLDATFTLSGTADSANMDNSFVIRTVFSATASADDVTGTMQLGDKLIRTSTETQFSWCDDTNCSDVRSDVAGNLITEAKLVNYTYPGDGNPNYVPFVVPISNNLTVSHAQLTTPESWWEVTFDMTNAIQFSLKPESISNRPSLLEAFELVYEPDQQNAGQATAISAKLLFSAIEPNVSP
ncbi:MAG: hypothetical protein GXP16_03375, partial [Gammaproteobacteria bacterium]|nr:hypothetical protein [Gammaproteobacteria bacterium]